MRTQLKCAAMAAALALAALPAMAAEATFTRTLTVSGPIELTVATGAGAIHITQGSANVIQIFGRVHSFWGADDSEVQQIASHPPIEQTGGIVRIGQNLDSLHNIAIDYEIQAPANTFLNATTGAGSLTDDGVGQNARLHSGSGSIRATGLHGSFTLETGSGSIYAEQTGEGDVRAHTGSGSIDLHDIHGGLSAQTGSGSIHAAGDPDAPWNLHTGAGSIEIWTGSASLDIDAESGFGSIHCDRQITSQGSEDRHHLVGQLGGGGPTVRLHTGAGSIRIH
ncbi:MAG: DUF4097 family beta strand repeat-containing protein [Terracidiphilus sp.]